MSGRRRHPTLAASGMLVAILIASAAAAEEGAAVEEPAAEEGPAVEEPAVDEIVPEELAAVEESAEADEPIDVRVIGRRADALQKVPGGGTLVTTKELEEARAYNLGEVLRRIPGVNVREDPGAGGRFDIGLRGLDPGRSRRVLILEDGIPVAINPYSEPDMYYRPPVERMAGIEVVKGSGNILFGPQTVGGVINFITQPLPYARRVRLRMEIGERRFFGISGLYGDVYGPVRQLSQVVFKRSDGYRDQGFQFVNVLSKVTFPTSDEGDLTLKLGLHNEVSAGDDVGLTAAMFAADPQRAKLAKHNRIALQRYELSLIHEQRFLENVRLKTLAYAYTTDRLWRRQDYERRAQPGIAYERIVGDVTQPDGAIYFRRSNRILDRNYRVAGVEPRLRATFDTGALSHTLDAGARLLLEGADYQQRAGASPTSEAGALDLDEQRRSLAIAAYVQHRLEALDKRLLVTPGLRLEHARYSRAIRRRPSSQGAEDVAIDGSSDVTALIPGIGMTAGLPEIHGFAGFHVGFAPPRASSSIRPNGESALLDAERSFAYEAGARVRYKRVLQASLTGFLTNFSNQVVPSTQGATTELVNGGSTQHWGGEAALKTQWGDIIGRGMVLDLNLAYTLLEARFAAGAQQDNRLPYAPQHNVSATLNVGHAIGFRTQFSYQYVGSQFTDEFNTVEQDVTGRRGRIDGYHVLDANVGYRHASTGLSAWLSVKNLRDMPYVVARRPEGIFASGFRQASLGLAWEHN